MAKTKKETTAASKPNPMLTAAQLERMTTHELADMLSNVVMLLRRMPDVACEALVAREDSPTQADTRPTTAPVFTASTIETQYEQNTSTSPQSNLKERIAELEGKKYTVESLKALAEELGIPYPTKPKKSDLAKRIAERQMRGHSEQYAMTHL